MTYTFYKTTVIASSLSELIVSLVFACLLIVLYEASLVSVFNWYCISKNAFRYLHTHLYLFGCSVQYIIPSRMYALMCCVQDGRKLEFLLVAFIL